jgi:hypothetical protein
LCNLRRRPPSCAVNTEEFCQLSFSYSAIQLLL